jgi:hypothetical protein
VIPGFAVNKISDGSMWLFKRGAIFSSADVMARFVYYFVNFVHMSIVCDWIARSIAFGGPGKRSPRRMNCRKLSQFLTFLTLAGRHITLDGVHSINFVKSDANGTIPMTAQHDGMHHKKWNHEWSEIVRIVFEMVSISAVTIMISDGNRTPGTVIWPGFWKYNHGFTSNQLFHIRIFNLF